MLNVTWACAPTAAQGPAERATNATAKRNSFFMVLCSLCNSDRGGLNPPRKTLTYRTRATQTHQAQLSRGDDGGDREFISRLRRTRDTGHAAEAPRTGRAYRGTAGPSTYLKTTRATARTSELKWRQHQSVWSCRRPSGLCHAPP